MGSGKNDRHDHCCQDVDSRVYQSLLVGIIVPRNSVREQWDKWTMPHTRTHISDTNKARERIDSPTTRHI